MPITPKPRGLARNVPVIRQEVLREDFRLRNRALSAANAYALFFAMLETISRFYRENLRGKTFRIVGRAGPAFAFENDPVPWLMLGENLTFETYEEIPRRFALLGPVAKIVEYPIRGIFLKNLENRLFSQGKRREYGLYIKARRTRSTLKNRLYIRVPHK